MSFQPLQQILNHLEQQPSWETHRQYRRLVAVWTQVVEPRVAKHTRPLYLANQVLWVATASSVWAQHLSLQRVSILKKLDLLLPDTVTALRFSSAHWSTTQVADSQGNSVHPSALPELEVSKPPSGNQDLKTAKVTFEDWAQAVQTRGAQLPLCPNCHCPTPPGELERWSLCACCIAQHWSRVT